MNEKQQLRIWKSWNTPNLAFSARWLCWQLHLRMNPSSDSNNDGDNWDQRINVVSYSQWERYLENVDFHRNLAIVWFVTLNNVRWRLEIGFCLWYLHVFSSPHYIWYIYIFIFLKIQLHSNKPQIRKYKIFEIPMDHMRENKIRTEIETMCRIHGLIDLYF